MSDSTNGTNWVEAIGAPCYSNIAEMVAALELDYERLEELRDERASLADDHANALQASSEAQKELEECPHEAEEPSESLFAARDAAMKVFDDARNALDDWDEENAEELKELEEAANPCGNKCESRDDAEEMIHSDALSVEVRSGWVSPGEDTMTPEEFAILLSTGGPATRIRGELDEHGEPHRAWLEVQDWGKPWTEYYCGSGSMDVLLTYARCFVFDA